MQVVSAISHWRATSSSNNWAYDKAVLKKAAADGSRGHANHCRTCRTRVVEQVHAEASSGIGAAVAGAATDVVLEQMIAEGCTIM